jgi:Domain of unknown function (DUF4160)
MTPEIARYDQFAFHVYCERGAPHHLPHCHVRRGDGSAETIVSLATLKVIVGPALARDEREALLAERNALIDAWSEHND